MSEPIENSLYIVSTPIGNLGDISHRALHILQRVALIAAEDTRVSRQLLSHYGINTPLLPVHEHNQREQVRQIVDMLNNGNAVALVSDAGTPLISDPGAIIVQEVIDHGLNVRAVPGASALLAGVVVSGLAAGTIGFQGFLSPKSAQRQQQLNKIDGKKGVFVCYESPRRIVQFLDDAIVALGSERRVAIGRELTKRFETVYRGSLQQVRSQLAQADYGERGEFVIVIETLEHVIDASLEEGVRVATLLNEELPAAKAAKLAAKICGVQRAKLYAALAQKP